jgi:hypothetical protein
MRPVTFCRTSLFAVIAIALAGAAGAEERSSSMQGGAQDLTTRTFEPIQSISYLLGSKRAIGYFEDSEGQCRVTLMIAEAVDPDVAMPTSATRLRLLMTPGQSAKLESVEGEAMVLTCGIEGRTVEVTLGSAPRRNSRPSVLRLNAG